jgi:hypothetical protein
VLANSLWNSLSSLQSFPQRLPQRVLPPWWATWWFRTLVVIFAGAAIVGVFTWRTRDIRERNRLLSESDQRYLNLLTNTCLPESAPTRRRETFGRHRCGVGRPAHSSTHRCGVGRPAHSSTHRCGVGRPAHSSVKVRQSILDQMVRVNGSEGQVECLKLMNGPIRKLQVGYHLPKTGLTPNLMMLPRIKGKITIEMKVNPPAQTGFSRMSNQGEYWNTTFQMNSAIAVTIKPVT